MRDFYKRISTSMDHLHDLVFDRFDEVDTIPLGSAYQGTIFREGYLFKQSRRVWKFWKTRYFVLRKDGLLYFRSIAEKNGRPLGVIPLRKLSVHLDAMTERGKPKYCVRLASGQSFKTFYCLCSFSKDERNLWFTSLLTAISQDLVSSCAFSLKYRKTRSSSASSNDSVLSEQSSSPNQSPSCSMPRTASCELGSLFRVVQHLPSEHKRPTSLSSLTELGRSPRASKKTRKASASPFRRLKALSTFDVKGWRGSYIDLSSE